jgi:hypothetical protein
MIRIGLIDLEMNHRCIVMNVPSTQFGVDLDGSKGTKVFEKILFYVLHDMRI